jgi:hypothetical protein
VMIPPSGRVPKKGCRWDHGGTEACGGVKTHLGLFLGVSLFIGFFSVGIRSDGATWAPRGTRARLGGGAPWCLMGTGWPPSSGSWF